MNPVICSNGKQVVLTSLTSECWMYSLTDINQNPQQILAERQAGKKSNVDSEAKGVILAASFSTSGKYFAAADDFKQIHLFSTSEQLNDWKLLSTRNAPKKGIKITFVQDDSCFIIADKFGDVHRFSVTSPELAGTVVLGHLSMLLDMTFLRGNEFIATCDRDEKLRVSRYPSTYNIQSFCLGHTKYVSCIDEVDKMLASGSGDGSVKLWNPLTGEQLCQHEFNEEQKCIVKFMVSVVGQRNLICAFDGMSELSCLSIVCENDCWRFSTEDDIAVSGAPLGMCVAKDSLLVLQDCAEQPLKMTPLLKECNYSETIISKINQHLKSKWSLFSDAAKFQSLFFDNLEKMTPDNIDEYIKKKKPGKRQADSEGQGDTELDCITTKIKPSEVC